MTERDRPNPYGLGRDEEGSSVEEIGDGRAVPVAGGDAAPVREEVGYAVHDWSAVHTVWTSNQYTSAGVIYALVRPWRYFAATSKPVAAGTREGVWIPDFEVEVALTLGAVTNARSGGYVWETRGAEKMYWQVVSVTDQDPDQDLAWIQEQCFGYMREDKDGHAVVVNSPNAGDGGGPVIAVIENEAVQMAGEDLLYSNVWGDFVVARTDANTLTLHDLPFPVSGEQILGIVQKVPGAVNATTEAYRGSGLQCQYTPATGVLDVNGFAFAAADDIIVYIEGPPRTLEEGPEGFMYRRVKTMNPDSKHVVTDGRIFQTLAEGANQDYINLNMAEDGYHYISIQHDITEAAYFTIEGSNDIGRDAPIEWDDITVQLTGLTLINTNTPNIIPPMAWCGYRRIRLVLQPGVTGGDIDVYIMRSADGATWSPAAYHGYTLADAGPQVMGEAKTYDGSAMPNSVTEGTPVRWALSPYGINYNMPVIQDGSESAIITHDAIINAANGGRAVLLQGFEGRSVQAAAVAEGDGTRAMANLYGEQVLANYIWATQANRTEEDDPIDTRDVGDILADATSVDASTTVDFYLDLAHYHYLSIQWIPNDANFTLKVYASLKDNGTAPAAVDYEDVTNAWFGAASFTTRQLLERDTPLQVKWVHIEVARSGGAGANTHKLYTRRCY